MSQQRGPAGTSLYPLTSSYDTPITHVGLFMDRARSIHGPSWPQWPFIQVFGGPDTGRWPLAQPTAADVRCMVYIALVHRPNGILYFSYWPRATNTWAEVGVLNRELQQMTPWLVARGEELPVTNSSPVARVRAKQTALDGASGILLCVNTSTDAAEIQIRLPRLKPRKLELRGLTGTHAGHLTDGELDERWRRWQRASISGAATPQPNRAGRKRRSPAASLGSAAEPTQRRKDVKNSVGWHLHRLGA